jgi:hypothetical protein
VRCVTLMVNRSDRRFPTLSPSRAREAARLIENEARGNPSRPGPHLMPDEQAGYMTATEFHIASALQPLHAGGVHIRLLGGAKWIRTLGTGYVGRLALSRFHLYGLDDFGIISRRS